MLPGPMKASDFTCMLCGSSLGLRFNQLRIGANGGSCPMCGEPFTIKLNKKEMEELMEAEETRRITA